MDVASSGIEIQDDEKRNHSTANVKENPAEQAHSSSLSLGALQNANPREQ